MCPRAHAPLANEKLVIQKMENFVFLIQLHVECTAKYNIFTCLSPSVWRAFQNTPIAHVRNVSLHIQNEASHFHKRCALKKKKNKKKNPHSKRIKKAFIQCHSMRTKALFIARLSRWHHLFKHSTLWRFKRREKTFTSAFDTFDMGKIIECATGKASQKQVSITRRRRQLICACFSFCFVSFL